ncbi:hypothetical protein Q7M_1248 (plasmid) [Borrelia crocidurae str. Achema]|uniref:Variable large protein n=1 Tax=Borrelia crocidurae (strain Achema) TaxID=1155096 RepID=I0FEU9_BORCA|nr:hypothetical protein Q7M_1248 [Borrelia crocidurae str. Achema]
MGILKGHLESLEKVGDSSLVGDAATNTQGTTVSDAE